MFDWVEKKFEDDYDKLKMEMECMKTNMEDVKMNMELMKWEFARIDTKLLVLEGNCEWLKGNVAIFIVLIVIVIAILVMDSIFK